MRELFNKAMFDKLTSAQYAVNEIQKQVIFNIFKITAILSLTHRCPFLSFQFTTLILRLNCSKTIRHKLKVKLNSYEGN